jgi:iron complex outermembrane receptor protein
VISHRWISGYKDQNANSAPFNVAPFNTNVVGSYALINLSVAYTGFKNTTLQGGILNLLDTDPPFTNQLSRFQARGYDDRFHNPLGRTFQLSAKYEF